MPTSISTLHSLIKCPPVVSLAGGVEVGWGSQSETGYTNSHIVDGYLDPWWRLPSAASQSWARRLCWPGCLRGHHYPVLLARTFLLFFGRIPKSGFGHEADRQKCYGCKNTCKFGVSANRIQWTTPRTRIRRKSRTKKVKTLFCLPEQSRDYMGDESCILCRIEAPAPLGWGSSGLGAPLAMDLGRH